MYWMGADPGKSGAIAIVDGHGLVEVCRLDETEHDVAQWMDDHRELIRHAILEKVSAMPRQGVSSTFKFGQSFGFVRGLLIACHIPFELATPQIWQKHMACLTHGDKNVSKAKAQELFPAYEITHHTADAILLAEYCRRTR